MTAQTMPRILGHAMAGVLMTGMLAIPSAALAEISLAQLRPGEVKRDVIYVPTPQVVVDRMLEMAGVTKEDYVIDLGSGDGRIPISAAKLGATALGVEIDPQRLKEAAENLEKVGPDIRERVEFRNENLFETDLGRADVISMYLLNSINAKLRPKLLELEPGTRVVSHAFNMGDWEADETAEVDGKRVFFWVVPARVQGNWTFSSPDGDFSASIEQHYQKFTGRAQFDGQAVELNEPVLRGSHISFTVETPKGPRKFTGTVEGDAITPAADADAGSAQGWSARRG